MDKTDPKLKSSSVVQSCCHSSSSSILTNHPEQRDCLYNRTVCRRDCIEFRVLKDLNRAARSAGLSSRMPHRAPFTAYRNDNSLLV